MLSIDDLHKAKTRVFDETKKKLAYELSQVVEKILWMGFEDHDIEIPIIIKFCPEALLQFFDENGIKLECHRYPDGTEAYIVTGERWFLIHPFTLNEDGISLRVDCLYNQSKSKIFSVPMKGFIIDPYKHGE